jgi:hypothetical protein
MKNKYIIGAFAGYLTLGLAACGGESSEPDGLGGAAGSPSGAGGEGGHGDPPVGPVPACAHGLALVMTDYLSTEIALLTVR